MTSTEEPLQDNTSSAAVTTEDESKKSALQDNIQRKGSNAYYFAHAHKATGPQWDGKPQPKLLSRSSSVESGAAGRRTPSSFDFSKSNITSYSFCDDGTTVKLYISLEGVGGQCTDENVTLDYTDNSFCFFVENYIKPGTSATSENAPPPAPLCLSFGRLTANITKAKYKIKPDRIILTLFKADPDKEWHTINDKGTPDHEVV